MTTWEYTVTPLLMSNEKRILDTWGADGWELVAVVPNPNVQSATPGFVAYFKRPKEN